MSRRALMLSFVLALSASLLATLPLRLILGARSGFDPGALDLSVADASGSIWSGRLRSVDWRGQSLGDVSVALDPVALLTGVLGLRLEMSGFSVGLLRGRRDGIDHANGELHLAMKDLPGVAVRLSLADASLLFANGRCRSAGGTVQAVVTGIGPPVRVSGPVRCDGENGSITLASVPGPGVRRVEAHLVIDGDGRYELRSLVQSADGMSALALRAAGFELTPMGLARTDRGQLY